MSNIGKKLLKSLLPGGLAWQPKEGGDLDKSYDAQGDIIDLIINKMLEARYTRDPDNTSYLSDLEIDFGIVPNDNLSDTIRRETLKAKINIGFSNGSAETLQIVLQNSGFDLQVHRNDPPVDPLLIMLDERNLVVENQERILNYEVPTDPTQWGFIFFIGGDATRDGSGYLTNVEGANLDRSRIDDFYRIVLAYKGLHSWGALQLFFISAHIVDATARHIVDALGRHLISAQIGV